MRHFLSFLIIPFLFTGCSFGVSSVPKDVDISQKPVDSNQTYHEFPINITEDDLLGDPSQVNIIIGEWHDQGKILYDPKSSLHVNQEMYRLEQGPECNNLGSDSKDCAERLTIFGHKEYIPEGFTLGDRCDVMESCNIIGPSLPREAFKKIASQGFAGMFFAYGEDIYSIGHDPLSPSDGGRVLVFKNNTQLFSRPMDYGADGWIREAAIVMDLPVFTFIDFLGIDEQGERIVQLNTWYEGETMNEKYALDGSSRLFSYKGKVGFFAEKNGKMFYFFNGQKISEEFDFVNPYMCCMAVAHPLYLDENGTLFFVFQRDKKYFFAEVDLNKYL